MTRRDVTVAAVAIVVGVLFGGLVSRWTSSTAAGPELGEARAAIAEAEGRLEELRREEATVRARLTRAAAARAALIDMLESDAGATLDELLEEIGREYGP